MNPLDRVGEVFRLSLANPNPKARRGKEGPRHFVTFEVDKQAFDEFMGCRELAGMVIEAHCTVSHLNDGSPSNNPERPAAAGAEGAGTNAAIGLSESRAPGKDRAPNELASRMHRDGYFFNRKLWAAMEAMEIYTAAEHKQWIESLACTLVSARHFDPLNQWGGGSKKCFGQVCAHHCSSASLPAAGTGAENPRKPEDWYTVPLCVGHHRDWIHGTGQNVATREQKATLLEYAVSIVAQRIKFHMKQHIGIESLRDITAAKLEQFEMEVGLR